MVCDFPPDWQGLRILISRGQSAVCRPLCNRMVRCTAHSRSARGHFRPIQCRFGMSAIHLGSGHRDRSGLGGSPRPVNQRESWTGARRETCRCLFISARSRSVPMGLNHTPSCRHLRRETAMRKECPRSRTAKTRPGAALNQLGRKRARASICSYRKMYTQ
jgi:hypothetical protein